MVRAQPEQKIALHAPSPEFSDGLVLGAAGVDVSFVVAGLIDKQSGQATNFVPG